MKIEITVFNPGGDRETSFDNFQYNHSGCGVVTQRRDLISSEYTLHCNCGIEIIFSHQGIVYDQIVSSVTDELPCILIEGGYSSNHLARIKVIPQDHA